MSSPSTSTDRIHVRWLSPTCPTATRSGSIRSRCAIHRWKPIATLHRPHARWPWSSSARVTMPTGFVKSTIHAPGAARSCTRSAISSITGTVRIAFAKPPAPVVSWPTQPQRERDRLVLVPRRLPADADLDEHEVGAVDGRVEIARDVQRARRSRRGRACGRAIAPTTSRRPSSMSCSDSRSSPSRSRSRASPATSSGVYVDPAPMTAILIPSPPSA